MTEVYKPHITYQTRRKWSRKRHSRKYDAWLTARQTVLNGTGTGQTYTVTVAGVAATGSLTFTGLPVADETFTIGDRVYTFKAAASASGEITIGADADGCRDAVIAALNGTDGINSAHPHVAGSSGGAGVVTLTAIYEGEKSNAIATTEALTNATVGGATLTGGLSPSRCTATTHGFVDGDGPYYLTAATTQPSGFASATPYWVEAVDANTFKLHASKESAITGSLKIEADESNVQAADTGTGTLTITPADSDTQAIHAWTNQIGNRSNSDAADIIQGATDVDNL